MEDTVLQVSEFIALLNQTLEFAYPTVSIEGEVSGYSGPNRNGHHYITLKDDRAYIKCVAFAGSVQTQLEDGMKVVVKGRPSHHDQYGFSFIARSIQPSGEGALRRAFLLLKAKLESEGLFDIERKRSLPAIPQRIGVISSSQAAGFADFIEILDQRWSGVDVLLADVQVQGDPAEGQIVQAVEYFNQISEPVDVLVIIRGGGSAEDLQAFSTEKVARAVAGSRTPTVVGVGHEVDTSLADLAADVRAATPTDAARLVVPDKSEYLQRILSQQRFMNQRLESRFDSMLYTLDGHMHRLAQFVERPLAHIQNAERFMSQRLDMQISAAQSRNLALEKLLSSLNPRVVLQRGYGLVRKGDAVMQSVTQVLPGDELMIELSDGKFAAEVINGKN